MKREIDRTKKDTSDESKVLDLAAYAGHILLENGAEIFRVEETMEKIANAYGMKGDQSFVLSSGIFLTEEINDHTFYAKVRHIPLNSVNLEKVARVNQLSREITNGTLTVNQAWEKLEQIAQMKDTHKGRQFLAYGGGSASFCYLFGGSIKDAIAALLCGIILYGFLCIVQKRKKSTSKIVMNLVSSGLVCGISILLWRLHIGSNLNHIMIGAIMPLLPGVAFTNAIRDLANEDYISGTVRMVDALLVAFCIAIGVGIVYTMYHRFLGGVAL